LSHFDPLEVSFSGRPYFGPYRVLPLKFLHVLEYEHGLLTHTQSITWVLPTIFNKQNVKIDPKFNI